MRWRGLVIRESRWVVLLMAGLIWTLGCGGEETAESPGRTVLNDPYFPTPGEIFGIAATPPGSIDYVPPGNPDRPIGATEFASADANQGQNTQENSDGRDTGAEPSADDDFAGEGGGERTVEEGDIYRVLGGNLILNLNAYRGVQVIDFSDVENPEIIGRLQISGSPVELYVVGDRAYVLLNNWRGYYGARDDVAIATRSGGLALSVDLSDPTEPSIIDQAYVPGYIQKSRLTRGGGQAALYVVTGGWAEWLNEDGTTTWDSRTYVKSFDVSTGRLRPRSELNLGGYIADIQATTEVLMVARNDWNWSDSQSRVAVVDISDPSGRMVMGDQVTTEGWINNQFNMDYYNGVLRVVSGSRWGSDRANWVQTFDASDLSHITEIDKDAFGFNEDLYATLFLGNKAFFVTYRRIDPFHAFEITDEGMIIQQSEFVVTGWNDFFRAVYDETRLIGIGLNDESGRAMAVSMYDITDLTNPEPLIERAQVEADYSWSEASWDHRAFSVLENAVEIEAPGGELETGMVLLPYSGWNSDWQEYTAAVQIFTFSESTLTRRGLMVHGTPVRRSFEADTDLVANLSEAALSFFDTEDPAQPEELGRVDLAPNFTDVMVFGDYRVRVQNGRDYYYSWWGNQAELPPATVELVPDYLHPDMGKAVASFEIASDATVYQSGDYLVTAEFDVLDTTEWPYTYETTLTVWDLTDPTEPTLAGKLVTDELQPANNYYYYGYEDDCWECGGRSYYYGGGFGDDVQAVPGGLVFLQRDQERELLGVEERCNTYPAEWEDCWTDDSEGCTYYSGNISCTSLDGAEPVCYGNINECTYSDDEYACEQIDPGSIETNTSCWEYERYRYWQHFSLETLDLTDPENPALADTIDLGTDNEGVSMLVDGSDVWVTHRRPYDVEDDSRPYVRYFVTQIDVSDLASPERGRPINVPGELLAVDGSTLFTRDLVWGDEVVETAIARLEIVDDLAYLEANRRFEDQYVYSVALDGVGHVLLSHRLHWTVAYERGVTSEIAQMMTILAAESDDLAVLSESEVDSWATMRDAREGRALFQVPGGLLVFNLDDATSPYPQAYFPTLGWPSEIIVDARDRDILFAAGRYGIYEFDLDAFNLLPLF